MKEEKEKTIQDVISRRKQHTRRVDSKLIMKAYNYAYSYHGDQCRKSGEPYIIHPLNVAYILADIGLDDSTICAALLHDVVEDTEVTQEDITREFGKEISDMVAGVTKLSNIQFSSGICEKLAFMGVDVDADANNMRGEEKVISKPDSKVKVYVIPTNEELMIAKETQRLVNII